MLRFRFRLMPAGQCQCQRLFPGTCSRLETYGSYRLASPWHWFQRQLRGVARSLAQWAGQLPLECEQRDRVVREELQRWVAPGMRQEREAEAVGRRSLPTAAMGGGAGAGSGTRLLWAQTLYISTSPPHM